jgi:NTP pyrophosphatase (non-canonical NTP hydrolase)
MFTVPALVKGAKTEMKQVLIDMVATEEKRGSEKWGDVDRTPGVLLNAALEELGEVAHAVNHNEGIMNAEQEIAETIGILSRLFNMLDNMGGAGKR